MVWNFPNATGNCVSTKVVNSCQSSYLTFLTFIANYLGYSQDDKFKNFENLDDEYDFIIVGAGSAGCIVANRLSEIKNWKILLLEAGDEQPIFTSIPGLASISQSSSIDYNYLIQYNSTICERYPLKQCTYARGKTMGGSTSINTLVYNRGNKQDFDDWANAGNPGWGWKDVLPYFKKSEDLKTQISSTDVSKHGTGGYLSIEIREKEKYTEALYDSWKELGFEEIDNNSGNQIGVSRIYYAMKNKIRQSNNDAFIRPIRGKRSNLTIKTNSQVIKIIIDPKTNKTNGVEYVNTETNVLNRVFAKKEVIVSAGTFESPKLLMLSGIGPPDDLRDAGIVVKKSLPVGKNYQEHPSTTSAMFEIKDDPTTLSPINKSIDDVIQFMNYREGPYQVSGGLLDTITYLQTAIETRPGIPDIQIMYNNGVREIDSFGNQSLFLAFPYRNAICTMTIVSAPKSRGWVKLNNTNPIWSKPLIFPNFNGNRQDIKTMAEGIKQTRQMMKTKAFKESGLVEINLSVPLCEKFIKDESLYYECIAEHYITSSYHGVGTCKMGPKHDSDAVVDSKLRVHGIKGLRVIDASIMPQLVRANPNAAIMMIGEKGSDVIKEDWLK